MSYNISPQATPFTAATSSSPCIDLTGAQEGMDLSKYGNAPESAVEFALGDDNDVPSSSHPSKVEVFLSRLRASDPDACTRLSTDTPLPAIPSSDRVETPASATSTLLGDVELSLSEKPTLDGPFFFKPVLNTVTTEPSKRISEELSSEKQALKQMLKLQIPVSCKHSLSHKRNAPADLPLMQLTEPLPVPIRSRRHSLPSSPFILVSGVDGDELPVIDTPDHLLYTGLDSALLTQRMFESPAFPETPDSAVFQTVHIRMMEPEDEDDGYISDPGSAVARYFTQPEKSYPSIQRGKQLPFPSRPAKPTSANAGSSVDREKRHARVAALRRRYHDLPSHYIPESPIRSPIRSFGRSLFDRSNKASSSSPLAGRPLRSLA